MTYTQFVSTMNHAYMVYGPDYIIESVDDWFDCNYKGYSIGLLEYCCRVSKKEVPENYRHFTKYVESHYVLTDSMKVMCDMMGSSYLNVYINKSIPEFIKHKVCITEVGNAI